MRYTTLGPTGITVSELCFGTMTFGAEADTNTSRALFSRCIDAGITFFDTANGYAGGASEEILGACMRGMRDDLVIATKVATPVGPGPNDRGASRRHIRQQVEGSLRRLGTDRIDLYYVHHVDERTPIETTLKAMDELVRQGSVIAIGVSNWAAWQIATALGVSAIEHLEHFACIQPMYSLVKRQAEVELLPLARSRRLAVVPYSPLGAGLLTGKYVSGAGTGRLSANAKYAARYGDPAAHETGMRFVEHARSRGVEPAALALAWVMAHPDVTAPIVGARDVQQLEASLGALDIAMTVDWREEIAALSPRPPSPTDRTEERASS